MKELLSTPLYTANPHASYKARQHLIDQAIADTLNRGIYVRGSQCKAFEEEFAGYIGAKGCVSVANGTDAITIALKALDLPSDSEIITTSHTAVATVAAIRNASLKPVLCDISLENYILDYYAVKKAITEKTKAIILVHLYGQSPQMDLWMTLCKEHNLFLIEDCAQAHGASWKGLKLGNFGIASTYSFYPTKNLGALGDGGAIVSHNDDFLKQARLLSEYGWKERYFSEIEGVNSRLDEIQAAVLRVKLPYLDQDNAIRHHLAQIYINLLHDVEEIVDLQDSIDPRSHVYHLFVIRFSTVEIRDLVKEQLASLYNIHTLIHYPAPIHLQKAYLPLFPDLSLPNTVTASQTILSLPLYPELSTSHVEYVAHAIKEILWKK